MHKKTGDNPHLWHDPATIPAVAKALAAAFTAADPAHADNYAPRLKSFLVSLQPLDEKIAAIRNKYAALPVTATEPVFGYIADALHLTILNQRFQLPVMRYRAAHQRCRCVRARFENAQSARLVLQ